jgi:hypothetical protein
VTKVPRPESPEGPVVINLNNIPEDVRKKLWLLKRVNMIMGGPTEYKTMALEALKYWLDSEENRRKLDLAEKMRGQLQQQGGGQA